MAIMESVELSEFGPFGSERLSDSLRLYYLGKIADAVDAINAHFLMSHGTKIIGSNVNSGMLFPNANIPWEFFVQWYLRGHWTRTLPLHLIFQDIWNFLPSRNILWQIGHLELLLYSPLGVPKGGYHLAYEESTFEALDLSALLSVISEACACGQVIRSRFDDPYGILPVIDDEYFEHLTRCQSSRYYAGKVRASIEDGFSRQVNNRSDQISKSNRWFLPQVILRFLYLPPREASLIDEKLLLFLRRFPDRVAYIADELQAFGQTTGAATLGNFIVSYTAGGVSPADPHLWWQKLIDSIKSGKRGDL